MALLAHPLALLAMAVATVAIKVVTLDMAPDSFDDQYQNCIPAMNKALKELNNSDFQQNPLFAKVWPLAMKKWQIRGSPVSPLSSSAQAIALMAYTMEEDKLYEDFNRAVRTAGSSSREYRENFHYKTLHFLLTQALGRLRAAQKGQCRCVYRGVRGYRFTAPPALTVRFGQFASASLCKGNVPSFGTDTVFKVQTCYGVDIHAFSDYPGEEEVLIPPFETFEVTEVTENGNGARIHLSSTGTFSYHNCEWLRGDTTGGSEPRAPFHLGGLLLATTALAVATGML